LQEKLKHHDTVRVRRAMEKSQWWSPQRLAAYQAERLQALLAHAEQRVPYYRRLFREQGLHASDIQVPRDLSRLPLLTKGDIRAHLHDMKADNAVGLARFNTGGSSGEPLIFCIGVERVSHDVAAKWRATRWWGVDIGDPEIVVWGSPIELGAQDRLRQLRDKIMRTKLLSAFEMSKPKLDAFIREIRAMRPRMLFGYPSSISHIALHADANGIRMNDLGIKVVFVTSERLYDHQRETIQRVFGCPVANGYGGRDAGFIAHECPSGGMHITAEDIIIEIVAPDGTVLPAGKSGEIVVTHLATRDFPFVRYRTGDIGTLGESQCPCGRGLPLLQEIQGRTTDFVLAKDGTVMHGLALIYVVRDLPGVKAFKILQESLDHTRVLLATDSEFSNDSLTAIVSGLKQRLGATVEITVDLVDEIPKEASGKFRYIVSRVAGANVEYSR
jgi:phenylacetate-CoA ligase